MDLMNKRRLKLAKAIYRKYIISGGTVAKKIKPVTKSFINERVCRSQLDSALFQQAKQEVQEVMEVEVYPVFLKSHVFLKYTQEICNEWENHQWDINSHKQETGNDRKEPINSEQEANSKQDINGLTPETGIDKQEVNSKVQEPKSGKKEVQRFLPELVEKREWAESEMVPANHKTSEHWESGYKLKPRMILGGVKADAHKTSLLHKPHIHCIPKDVHAEPHKFAADLISRLELVQRERENWRRVKEHLHPVSTVCQEHDDAEVSTASPLCPAHLVPAHHGSSHSTVQLFDTHTENPEIILDQHGQCGQSVTRTPSLRSPITHTHTCPSDSDTWLYGDMAGTNQSKVLSYSRKCVCKSVTVAYYFCGEPIPYRTTVKGGFVTLAHFRELLTKKGAYRFFFKRASDEFDCGVVYEEVCEDDVILPLFEGRIVGKVERIY